MNPRRRIWIGPVNPDADYGHPDSRHSSTRFRHYPFWRHVQHFGVWWAKAHSVIRAWRDVRGDACRWPFVDPCHLREMLVILPRKELKPMSEAKMRLDAMAGVA